MKKKLKKKMFVGMQQLWNERRKKNMKFSEQYPDMKPIFDQRKGIIKGTTSHPCHWCGEETMYVEIHYEGPFCSEKCLKDYESSIPEIN